MGSEIVICAFAPNGWSHLFSFILKEINIEFQPSLLIIMCIIGVPFISIFDNL